MTAEDDQRSLVAFLSQGTAYGDPGLSVDHITTHISHIFLAGDRAYKLKRAVTLPYVDFSTLAARRAACERELLLNRRTAPELYLRVVAVTRGDFGGFALDGSGKALDWLVEMRRFDQDRLLARSIDAAPLSAETLRRLGDAIAHLHKHAETVPDAGGAAAIGAVIDGLSASFAACPVDALDQAKVDQIVKICRSRLDEIAPLLDSRRRAGKVRRCHGDLHLNNICLVEGRPVLFDCLEFNETLATIDVLYDLAFLLMDLLHRGLDAEANAVMNRYLDRTGDDDGIAALPLMMAIRSAIRCHVLATTARASPRLREARAYCDLALTLIEPAPARLVAVGGLSGAGKSTLAYRLAPRLGQKPGARVLRSDVFRKLLFGLMPETRLGPEGYSVDISDRVYDALIKKATSLLAAGWAVIVDAVFVLPDERGAISRVAADGAVAFTGFWLEAPPAILEDRVATRVDDASDADVAVVRKQRDIDCGHIDWFVIDAALGAGEVTEAARLKLS